MVELFKEFTFEAAHRVPDYSDVHGHSFQATIHVTDTVDPEKGWVEDSYV